MNRSRNPMKRWPQELFARLTRGEASENAFIERFLELRDFYHQLYMARALAALPYAGVLCISRILDLCRGFSVPQKTLIVGMLLSAFGNPGLEEIDKACLKAGAKRAIETFVHRTRDVVPALLLKKLLDWRADGVFRAVLEYAYFGYTDAHRKLLDESRSSRQWHHNLRDLLPLTCIRLVLDYSVLGSHPNFTLSGPEISRFGEEERKLEEMRANIVPMLRRFESVGVGGIGVRLRANRELFRETLSEKGRIETRKFLIFQHRNKLWMPTYQYENLLAELQRL